MSSLALTRGSAYLNLGWLNGVLNIGIAVAKALLVMLFFMHLRSSRYVLHEALHRFLGETHESSIVAKRKRALRLLVRHCSSSTR